MILQKDATILRKESDPVKEFKAAQPIILQMAEAMFNEPDGIGIAAPQIGFSLRIFLVAEDVLFPERFEEEKKRTKNFITFINPSFTKLSRKKTKDVEGCLSVRGLYGDVSRPEKVSIEYSDESGKKKSRGAAGLFARVLQHEMDHLGGILFIDRARNIQKLDVSAKS
ncbi:peptide deformylase [Candidatus Giovannonibacteria bacterium]|nr:peptide deformylase [Candidatus Giovannonibacteria bacterium]